MTHATAEEIHDHAYGFRVSEHIADCAECGRAAAAVTAERETLHDVLDEEDASAPPELFQRLARVEPQRRRIGSAGLAAAAILLAALAWVLFQPKSDIDSSGPASPPPTQEAEIERLIAEYKSGVKVRQEIAWPALRAYGASAVEPLIKARVNPALIDECRGISIADQQVIEKLKTKRLTVDVVNSTLVAVVDHLREQSGANFQIVGVDNSDSIMLTFKLSDGSIYDCLDRVSEVTKIPFSVRNGIVVVGQAPPAPESWAPLRFAPRIEAAKELAASLKAGSPREQGKAVEDLRKLGFSAEPVLWDLLDSTDLTVQSYAAHLLRTLYMRGVAPGLMTPFPPRTAEVLKTLDTSVQDVDFTNASALDILADLSTKSGISILVDPQVDIGTRPVTFKCKDLILKNILKLFFSQFALDYVAGDGFVLVSKPGRVELSNPVPIWLPAQEVKAAQKMLQDAVSPESAKRAQPELMKVGRPALAWLGSAADASSPVDAVRYRALQQDLADSLNVWIIDRPSGIDLQTLSDAQKKILARPMEAGRKGLENLPVVVKSPGEVRVICSTTPGLRLGAFLKAIARIQGLDIYMNGNDVVIDTAANVRKRVER